MQKVVFQILIHGDKNNNMKAFVFSGNEYTIDEHDETVVGIIEGDSRASIIYEFKNIYLIGKRTFEDYPDLGYAEIYTPDNLKVWRVSV